MAMEVHQVVASLGGARLHTDWADRERCSVSATGDSVALSVTSSSNYCTRWYTSVFQNHFFLAFTFAHLAR
jgi:hypothetical protein